MPPPPFCSALSQLPHIGTPGFPSVSRRGADHEGARLAIVEELPIIHPPEAGAEFFKIGLPVCFPVGLDTGLGHALLTVVSPTFSAAATRNPSSGVHF